VLEQVVDFAPGMLIFSLEVSGPTAIAVAPGGASVVATTERLATETM
jgi:hypothetical protein